MTVLLFSVADSAVVDQQTNRLSIFNLLEEMSAPGFPAMHSQMAIIAVLNRQPDEPSDVEMSIRIRLNDIELINFPITISFAETLRARFVGNLAGLMVPSAGTLMFELRRQSETISVWHVPVREAASTASPQTGHAE